MVAPGTRSQVLSFRMRAQQLDRDTVELADATVLAWTIRGAPHVYRLEDLPSVAAAVEPFSESDAGKRIFEPPNPSGRPASATSPRLNPLRWPCDPS